MVGHRGARLPVHECSYWSMETAEWLPDADGGTLLLAPPDDSALLRIYTVGAWAPAWNGLLAEARRRAPKGAAIEPVTCGAFSGLKYEGSDAKGDYWCEWLLTLGECFLLVSYSTAKQHRDRDRALVDRLLSTLADRRA
jgi:hypothetical protein